MEEESSYLASLISKLYENTASGFNFTSDEDIVKVEPGVDKDDSKPNSKKRKVVDEEEEFFKNSSAAIIAESTEKTLKQMNIDPNSKEGKMQRRKIRNRMSAQIHRDRKKAYIDYLEDKVRKRDEVISILHTMLKKNHLEISQLRENLAQAMNKGDIKVERGSTTSVQIPSHMPMPIISPANSSTSTESTFQHTDGSSGSQSSSSPEIDHDYFSDFDSNPDGCFDPKIFNTDDGMWDSQPYEDLTNLDFDQSLSEDDILKVPLQGATVGGGSLSLFSIVMMMSFSFFTGIISMSSVTGGTSSLSLIDSRSQIATSLSEPWTLNNVNDVVSDSREVDYSYGLLSNAKDKDVAFEDSVVTHPAGHGRVLLSLPSNNDDDDSENSYTFPNHAHHIPPPESAVKDKKFEYVIKSPTTRLPSTYSKPRATLSSLWHRQNYEFIGSIYPTSRNSKGAHDANKTYTDMANGGRKYLRFRPARGIENVTSSETTTSNERSDRDSNVLHASEKSVTLYSEPKKVAESTGSSETASPLASKVLLSEGRVLLNPLLADLRNVHNDKESTVNRSPDYETDRAIIPSPPNSFGHSMSADDKGRNDNGASNLLTMMIPASSIQWGFEWLDDSSPDNSALVMNHLLKNFNLSTTSGLFSDQGHASEEGEGAETESQSTVDMSKLWLEIGCSVVDAKIVQSNL
jgi:hypothetical protein